MVLRKVKVRSRENNLTRRRSTTTQALWWKTTALDCEKPTLSPNTQSTLKRNCGGGCAPPSISLQIRGTNKNISLLLKRSQKHPWENLDPIEDLLVKPWHTKVDRSTLRLLSRRMLATPPQPLPHSEARDSRLCSTARCKFGHDWKNFGISNCHSTLHNDFPPCRTTFEVCSQKTIRIYW